MFLYPDTTGRDFIFEAYPTADKPLFFFFTAFGNVSCAMLTLFNIAVFKAYGVQGAMKTSSVSTGAREGVV